MSDWPHAYLPPLPTIHCASEEAYGPSLMGVTAGVPTSGAQFTQHGLGEAMLFPFSLDVRATVVKGWWMNGATVTAATNVDVGVYDSEFNLIVAAGFTAQSGTDTLQEADLTDTDIGPGDYWCALAIDNNTLTTTFFGWASVGDEEWFGSVCKLIGNGGDCPLPSTPANLGAQKDNNNLARIALYGIAFSTVI